jgi:histidyl-tRNA synthetase
MKKSSLSFAFEPYDGPLLEEVDLYLAKSGEELINDQIYSFTDRGDRRVAIRPEMTPTLARMVASVHRTTAKPLKWFSIPNVMRYEKPQRGRLREHWQFNADIFGAPKYVGETEILNLIISFLRSFKADESMFSIQLNDRAIVDSLFNQKLNLSPEAAYKLYKVIDKAKKVNKEALDKMIGEIITEDSSIEIFNEYLLLDSFSSLATFTKKHELENVSELMSFTENLKDMELDKYINYDPTIVRGLDYYTGVVFEVFDLHPDNRRAIAGGGAYANLLEIFNEDPLAGVGFGMGDVTLRDFLETHKLLPNFENACNDIMLFTTEESGMPALFKIANDLRERGMRVETYLGTIKFNKIIKTAQNKGHTNIGVIGSNELTDKKIQIKNLTSKEQENFNFDNSDEIREYITRN